MNNPWEEYKELDLTRREPTPIVASLISNNVFWEEVDCHREYGPPVLAAVGVLPLVGEPYGPGA